MSCIAHRRSLRVERVSATDKECRAFQRGERIEDERWPFGAAHPKTFANVSDRKAEIDL